MQKFSFKIKKVLISLIIGLILVFSFSQFFPPGQSPLGGGTAYAAIGINRQINFQGKLVNNPSSTNVSNTSYTVVFTLYDNASGGTALWTETQSVTTVDGIFRVALGSVTPFPANFNFNWSGLYLGIKVNADAEMTPRVQMAAVPFAFNAEKVAGLTVQDTSGNASTSGTLQVGNGKTISFSDNISFGTGTTGLISLGSSTNTLTLTTSGNTTLALPTSGTLCTTVSCLASDPYWSHNLGALFPNNSTEDFLIGGQATTSALFSYTGVSSLTHQTIASVSGSLIVMPNNGYGQVGIGTTSPNAALTVSGPSDINTLLSVTSKGGLNNSSRTGSGIILIAGQGGLVGGGDGGPVTITAGQGGLGSLHDGVGGNLNLTAGAGGTGTNQGSGGNVIINGGAAGSALAGNIILGNLQGNVGIGTIAPTALLHVNGGYSNNAALIVNNLNSGNLFVASASGTTKFVVGNSGLVSVLGGQTSDLDTLTGTTLKIGASTATTITLGRSTQGITLPGFLTCTLKTDGSGVLTCGTDNTGGAGSSPFAELTNLGLIVPNNSTEDFLIGGQATTSAKFGFLNVAGGTPTASISAGVAGGLYLTATGTIQTTASQTLTLGGNTTGAVNITAISPVSGASGGSITITGGQGSSGTSYSGGAVTITAGQGNPTNGGQGGALTLAGGAAGTSVSNLPGGDVSIYSGAGTAGAGGASPGNINIRASAGGTGAHGTIFIGNNSTSNVTIGYSGNAITLPGYLTCTLKTDGSGVLTCGTDNTGSGGSSPFAELTNLGLIVPNNSTEDFLIGGQATTSALFSYTGVSSLTHQTIASVSGSLIVMPNNGYGQVGIGTTSPNAALTVSGPSDINTLLSVTSKGGLNNSSQTGSGIILIAGQGGLVGGGDGGPVTITAGQGGLGSLHDGVGGNLNLTAGAGGTGTNQGSGGNVIINGGAAGSALAGNIILGNLQGNVGIGTIAPTALLHLNGGYSNNAALIVNNLNSGDLFAASASGTTKFVISNGGAITTGTWNGTKIGVAYGGTNLTTVAAGSVLAANSLDTLSAVTSTSGLKVLQNSAGTTSWATTTGTGNVVYDNTPTLITPVLGVATGTSLALGTNPAAAGTLRLPNATYITARNAANNGDINMIQINASNLVAFGANTAAFTLGGTVTGNSQNITGAGAITATSYNGNTFTTGTGTITLAAGKTASFADAFTTSGAFALTLTSTNTTNATIPSGTITLVDTASSQTLTTKTIGSTGLTFSAAATDVTTGTNEDFTITPNGSGKVVLGTTTNGLTFDPAAGPTYNGTGQPVKKITLSPEYAGATLTAFNGAATETNITGSVTSDTDTATDAKNYYSWVASSGTQQFYVVAVRVTLPQDFSSWPTSNAVVINYITQSATTSNSSIQARIYNDSRTSVYAGSAIASTSWTTTSIGSASLTNWNTAGATAVIYLDLGSASSNYSRIGDIVLTYNSKF